MDSRLPRCAVTGANGYVGSCIANYFIARGWNVLELARRPSSALDDHRAHVPYELGSPLDTSIFGDSNVSVLIHCAYDFSPVRWQDIRRVNVEGSMRLLRAAKKAGVKRIIFISSISAFEGCRSRYGKSKIEGEKIARDLGALIIRSGLVYGNRSTGGMFGSLQRTVTKSAIVPLIGSGKYLQYLVHENDLCDLIFRFGTGDIAAPEKPVVAASPNGWYLRDLLRAMASANHKYVKLLPLPWPVVWLGLKMTELIGVAPPFRSDSVISLVRQNPKPDFSSADSVGCAFRDFKGVPE